MGKFGERIKLGRLIKGYTQEELGRKLGRANSSNISSWETGQRLPRATQIPKLARTLEIEASELAQLWLADSLEKVKEKGNG